MPLFGNKNFLTPNTHSKEDLVKNAMVLRILVRAMNEIVQDAEIQKLNQEFEKMLSQAKEKIPETRSIKPIKQKEEISSVPSHLAEINIPLLRAYIELNFNEILYGRLLSSQRNSLEVDRLQRALLDAEGPKERKYNFVDRKQRLADRTKVNEDFQEAIRTFTTSVELGIITKGIQYPAPNPETTPFLYSYDSLLKKINAISKRDINFTELSKNGLQVKIETAVIKEGDKKPVAFYFEDINNFSIPYEIYEGVKKGIGEKLPNILLKKQTELTESILAKEIQSKIKSEKKAQKNALFLKYIDETNWAERIGRSSTQSIPAVKRMFEDYINAYGTYPTLNELERFYNDHIPEKKEERINQLTKTNEFFISQPKSSEEPKESFSLCKRWGNNKEEIASTYRIACSILPMCESYVDRYFKDIEGKKAELFWQRITLVMMDMRSSEFQNPWLRPGEENKPRSFWEKGQDLYDQYIRYYKSFPESPEDLLPFINMFQSKQKDDSELYKLEEYQAAKRMYNDCKEYAECRFAQKQQNNKNINNNVKNVPQLQSPPNSPKHAIPSKENFQACLVEALEKIKDSQKLSALEFLNDFLNSSVGVDENSGKIKLPDDGLISAFNDFYTNIWTSPTKPDRTVMGAIMPVATDLYEFALEAYQQKVTNGSFIENGSPSLYGSSANTNSNGTMEQPGQSLTPPAVTVNFNRSS